MFLFDVDAMKSKRSLSISMGMAAKALAATKFDAEF
jgi:hypothetical protein